MNFVDLATDQLLAPFVARRFELLGLNDVVPEIVERYFRAFYKLNRNRNTQLHKEALQVSSALNEVDIVPHFLKGGAGLLSGLYEEPGVRMMSDLDILIPAERADDCIARLEAQDYLRSGIDSHPYAHSLGSLARASSITAVDVHREVLAYPHQKLLSARDVIDCAEIRENDGAHFAVPCLTHQVILNIAHAQLNDHACAYGHLPFRSLLDFSLLLESAPDRIDWREIDNRFRSNGCGTALGFHCLAACELLQVKPATSLRPNRTALLLLQRARFMVNYPRAQRISFRVIRVFLLLRRELSDAELRARLTRNLCDPGWWRRHLGFFWRGVR